MTHSYSEALVCQPVLRTSRLLLRTPVDEDIPAIVAIAGDREVASRLARMPHPYSEADARFFLDSIVTTELTWAIVEQVSDEMVGIIGLAPCGRHPGSLELGYYVARERWGRGIATEAASVVVAYGVGLVGAERIRSGFFSDNPASGRVLNKLGFVTLGEGERACAADGKTKPSFEVVLDGVVQTTGRGERIAVDGA